MSTKRLYQRAQKEGKKLIERGMGMRLLKNGLKKKGLNRQEISISINLMACILYLDSKIFSENNFRKFFFTTTEQKRGRCACFGQFIEKEMVIDGYKVQVKNIAKILKCRDIIILYEKDGRKRDYKNLPIIPRKNVLLSYAVHEVRHRLQIKGIKMFDSNLRYEDSWINRYLCYHKARFDSSNDYPDVKDSETRKREFDARMIEYLSLYEMYYGVGESRLCEIIKMEGVAKEE